MNDMHEALTELSQAMRGNMKTLREEFSEHVANLGIDKYTMLWHIAKQMDALLEECAKAFEWYREDSPKDIALHEKLQEAGYGNAQ